MIGLASLTVSGVVARRSPDGETWSVLLVSPRRSGGWDHGRQLAEARGLIQCFAGTREVGLEFVRAAVAVGDLVSCTGAICWWGEPLAMGVHVTAWTILARRDLLERKQQPLFGEKR